MFWLHAASVTFPSGCGIGVTDDLLHGSIVIGSKDLDIEIQRPKSPVGPITVTLPAAHGCRVFSGDTVEILNRNPNNIGFAILVNSCHVPDFATHSTNSNRASRGFVSTTAQVLGSGQPANPCL